MPSIVTSWADRFKTMPLYSSVSSVDALLLRRMACTLATRILGLNGLDIYSSTPSSNPRSSSFSSPLAVSMIIGTLEYCLISRQVSQPSIFGIITSSITREISLLARNTSTASSPSAASNTLKFCLTRKSRTSFRIRSSSSTTKIVFSILILHSGTTDYLHFCPEPVLSAPDLPASSHICQSILLPY